MGLGLLAGIATAGNSIMRGMEAQKERDIRDEELQYQRQRRAEEDQYLREQRDNARADRGFGLAQRQRLIDTQGREDQLRSDLQAIPSQRTQDFRTDAVKGVTVDDEGTPSATQIPATKVMPVPDHEQFRARAAAYRKAGQEDKAMLFDEAAKRALFAASAKRFNQVASEAGSMDLTGLARSFADIYNNDPLPAKVRNVVPNADGSVTVEVEDAETGRKNATTFKDKASLVKSMEAYYSPDTYAAAAAEQRKSALKRQEALDKPATLAPGEIQFSGGKVVARNDTPTAAQLRAQGAGAGAGSKPGDQFKVSDDAFEFVFKNSTIAKELPPAQIAEAQKLNRQFFVQNPRVDPTVAVHAAIQAITDPGKITPHFDDRSGKVVLAMPYDGGNFIIREPKPKELKPEQLQAVAAGYVEKLLPEKRDLMVPASFDKQARRRLSDALAAEMRSPEGLASMEQELGRKPTPADIQKAIAAADKSLEPGLELISSHGDRALKSKYMQKPGSQPAASYGLAGAAQPAAQGAAALDDRTLARVAAIPGHAQQAAAQQELRRRAAARAAGAAEELPSSAAGMLNMAP